MNNRIIVALEIGSSKIKGLAAEVGALGDINVIAIEEVKMRDCVRYGKIQNVQDVSTHVGDIIRKIENNPKIAPRKITDVFVSVGGRSLTAIKAKAQKKFDSAVEITAEAVEKLKKEATFNLVTEYTTLAMLPHTFSVDNDVVKKVVGSIGSTLSGEFVCVSIASGNLRNLELIKFDGRTINRHKVIRPLAIADMVLTSSDRQLGCALVDFGAETTTITIYKNDALQTIKTLPMGSRNITRDLMTGLSMTEDNAEATKIDASNPQAMVDSDVQGYISARAGEIAANINHQIDLAGFDAASLGGGIVLVGGGAEINDFASMLESMTKTTVIRASIDGSVQFKGVANPNANIDILAIAKYAAEQTDIDCLEPLPEPVKTEKEEFVFDEVEMPVAESGIDIDDPDLLNDDDDDFEEAGSGRAHVRGVVHQREPQRPERKPKKKPVVEKDESDDVAEPAEHNMGGKMSAMKDKLAKWLFDTHIEETDLDEEVKG